MKKIVNEIWWRIRHSRRAYNALQAQYGAHVRLIEAKQREAVKVVVAVRGARSSFPATQEWPPWMRNLNAALNDYDEGISNNALNGVAKEFNKYIGGKVGGK